MPVASSVCLAQRICMQHAARHAAQLIDDVDAQSTHQVVHLPLRLCIQTPSGVFCLAVPSCARL
eukprot:1666344-Alexandrium_andersonii.AAC.1